jgi:hypothetical protein
MDGNRADIRWLALGAVLGLSAAAYGILRQSDSASPLPDQAIASVNGVIIGRDVYDRSLERMGAENADAARLLERLIADELLVQRGVDLGMTESDSEVRNAIVNSLIASVTAEADAASPDDAILEKYLADNAARFSFTSRLHVEAWQTEVEPVAQEFVAALRAGAAPDRTGVIQPMPDLPDGQMAIDMLRNYLGPAITAAAADMPEGSSAVFARRGRWLVIRVVAKERMAVTDLEGIRNRVLLDYRRNLADELLADYVERLRNRAEIRTRMP